MLVQEPGIVSATLLLNNEEGQLHDELGYQRRDESHSSYVLRAMRLRAYLEYGIDLRNLDQPVPCDTTRLP